MIIAGNQSYFFPYLGYFQLINAVDKFNLYDNLNFVAKGWVNRNNILVKNSGAFMITLPLTNRSSFAKIRDLKIDDQGGTMKWRKKICKTIYDNYRHAPKFNEIYPYIESLINYPTNYLSALNTNSIISICEKLKINTIIESDPDVYHEIENLLLDERYISLHYGDLETKIIRVIEICRFEGTNTIYNSIGGAELYSREIFEKFNINIKFLKSSEIRYKQFNNEFLPNLSIIDVLMFNDVERISKMLNDYILI